jgi:hypothetical protein
MKTILKFFLIFFLTITLSNCKKDCNGSYTIEGTLWNGTKNQPRRGILVKAVAGKGNSLFSGGSNVRDAGNARTDENGYFKIVYNCIGDDMTGISLSSSDLPYSGISNDDRLPINQDYKRTYNIPDSVSLNINFSSINGLSNSDTLYVLIAIPDNTQRLIFTKDNQPNGLYKTFRMEYKKINSLKFSINYLYAIGYTNYSQLLKGSFPISQQNNVSKLEPEVNSLTIVY